MLNLVSWNVNGMRAVITKGFMDWLKSEKPDILGLQEIKVTQEQLSADFLDELSQLGYESLWNPADKPGYSGTALLSRIKPVWTKKGWGNPVFDAEGRVTAARFETAAASFILYNIYFPNGQMSAERLKYKLDFYEECLMQADKLKDKGENVIIIGDYNTAHKEIDLKNPKENQDYSGFLPIERAWIDKLIAHGYVDTFRAFHPEPEQYSWWTYRFKARERNVGWRIDYVFVNQNFMDKISDAFIRKDVAGSDHCPVGVQIKL